MRRRYGSRRRWGVRRQRSNSMRRPFAWAPLGPAGLPMLTLSAGTPEASAIVLTANSVVQAQSGTVLDRSPGLSPTLERIIIQVTVIVVAAAIKKLIRVFYGARLAPVDPSTQLLVGNQPSVLMGASLDRRQDWLYLDSRTVNTMGDATIQYTLDAPWNLDFKPRRKFERDTALVMQAYADVLDGGSLDCTVKVRAGVQVGLLVPRT